MFKILFLLLSTTLFLFSNPIKFKEEKYINALQSSVSKNGVLKVEDNFIEIIYQGSDKSFVFYDDYIGLKTKEKEEILKYEENMELTIFSKLIKSIYKNQQDRLTSYYDSHHIQVHLTFPIILAPCHVYNTNNFSQRL